MTVHIVKWSVSYLQHDSLQMARLAVLCSCPAPSHRLEKPPVRTPNNTHVVRLCSGPTLLLSLNQLLLGWSPCLANAQGNTCIHTGHTILSWTHLSTWPTQLSLLLCSIVPLRFHIKQCCFCAVTSIECVRGKLDSLYFCWHYRRQSKFTLKQVLFIKLGLKFTY